MADSTEYDRWAKRIKTCKDGLALWQAHVSTCMHFANGNHRIWFDEKGMQREKVVQDNEVWRTVNKFPSTLSRIASRMTASQPRWNPVASEMEDVSDEEMDAADAVLQDIWEGDEYGDNALRAKAKFVARESFLQGRVLTYYRFDKETDMPVMDCYSLWDVFSDSPPDLKDKKWLAIALPKTVDWIKSNPDFDRATRVLATADQRFAESGLKQQYEQKRVGNNAIQDTEMVYYTFEVVKKGEEPDEEEVTEEDMKKDDKKKSVIRYQVLCKEGVLQKSIELDYPRLSAIFDSYSPVEDGTFYTRPLAADWIDPQKSINKINSSIESYIDNFLQGKWIIRDDTVSIPIAGRQGQKIKDPTGSGVMNIPLQPLPQTHFQYAAAMERHFQDASGVSEGAISQIAGVGDSGKAIAQLKAIDESNQSDPVDNFSMFLSRSGKKLLRQAADNWSSVRTVYRFDKASRVSTPMKIVGEGSFNKDNALHEGVTRIRPFKRLDVEIEVGALFKKSQMRQEIKELFQMGWTPGGNPVIDMVILESYTIGYGRNIVRELKKLQNPMLLLAEANSQLITQGKEVIINGTDQHEFLANFYASRAEEMLKGGNQSAATALNAQSQRHRIILQQQGSGAGSSEMPESLGEMEQMQGVI